MANDGKERETTLPAATTVPWPIRTPGRIVELIPIHTESSITMGLAPPLVLLRISGASMESSWPFPSMMFVFAAIRQLDPMEIL